MNNNQLAEVARILGVSEDSISAMDDEIKNSMTAVFEQIAVKNDEDKKAVFEALDNLWQKGSIYIELSEVAEVLNTTIGTLQSRPDEVQLALCKTYVNFWLCDKVTIQRELERIHTLNGRMISDIQEYELGKTKAKAPAEPVQTVDKVPTFEELYDACLKHHHYIKRRSSSSIDLLSKFAVYPIY